MSAPLPLRLCCMAAMAPALTETATQAKIKLPETSSTAASSDSVNRRNIRPIHREGHLEIPSEALTKLVKPYSAIAPSSVPHLNGDPRGVTDKTPVFSKLQTVQPLQTLNKQTLSASKILFGKDTFQSEFLKAINTQDRIQLGKLPQIMNQPSSGIRDNEEGKCHSEIAQTGSRQQSVNDIAKNAKGTLKAPQTLTTCGRPPLNQGRTAKNMCRKIEGSRPVPSAKSNIAPGPSPGGSQTNRPLTNPQPAQTVPHFSTTSSPDTNTEGEKDDEEVQIARAEAAKKHAQLERRFEFLLRRLRRCEAKQIERHARKQISTFVQYQNTNLQTVAKTISAPSMGGDGNDLKKELLSDDCKNLSTAALVSLVQRMQQKTNSLPHPLPTTKPEMRSVLTMSTEVRSESKIASEKLEMNLKIMQSALDSDATESSSGGESEEDDGCEPEDLPSPTTPLMRRVEWKWACERAAVASRWTWLQAQVSDLEYRIRQQSEIYRQARNSKGNVVLGEPPAPQEFLRTASVADARVSGDGRLSSALTATVTGNEVSPCNVNAVMSNVDKQASRLTQSLGNCLSPANTSPASSASSSRPKSGVSSPLPAPNGLIDSPLSSASVDVEGNSPVEPSADTRPHADLLDLSPVLDPTCRAARCLPLKHPLRKRKLLRIAGLHHRSPKAARLSTVKCHCHRSLMPCVLCCGRVNYFQTVDADVMPVSERVALLDHSYHQVLSFQEEVPLSVHFESLLRSGEWQNKPPVRRSRAETGQRRQKFGSNTIDGRKVSKKQYRKNAASVILQSAKIRNKYDQKTTRKVGAPRGKRVPKGAMKSDLKHPKNGVKKRNKGISDVQMVDLDSPTPSPLPRDASLQPPSWLKDKDVRKRRGESAYDINNIVIPHSMASLTRVEKLEYKEIPIPSWRCLSEEDAGVEELTAKMDVHDCKSNGLIAKVSVEDEEVEDLSDAAYITRHNRSEAEEKKRFSNFVQYPATRRNRAHSHISLHLVDSGQDPARPPTPSLPVSMGTQASLDCGDSGGGDDSLDFSAPHTPLSSAGVHFSLGSVDEDGAVNCSSGSGQGLTSSSRRGSVSSQRDRLSLGSSMDESEWTKSYGSSVEPWPARHFPLSQEEVHELHLVENNMDCGREGGLQYSLRPLPMLRPPPVSDGGSQAGSSLADSLPASPLPSSSSASAVGDLDSADPEWIAEAESSKKLVGHHKVVKR